MAKQASLTDLPMGPLNIIGSFLPIIKDRASFETCNKVIYNQLVAHSTLWEDVQLTVDFYDEQKFSLSDSSRRRKTMMKFSSFVEWLQRHGDLVKSLKIKVDAPPLATHFSRFQEDLAGATNLTNLETLQLENDPTAKIANLGELCSKFPKLKTVIVCVGKVGLEDLQNHPTLETVHVLRSGKSAPFVSFEKWVPKGAKELLLSVNLHPYGHYNGMPSGIGFHWRKKPSTLPEDSLLYDCTQLERLRICGHTAIRNPGETTPFSFLKDVTHLTALTSLELSGMQIRRRLPVEIGLLTQLKELNLSTTSMQCNFLTTPDGIDTNLHYGPLSALQQLSKLNLRGHDLDSVPAEVFALPALVNLDLSDNLLIGFEVSGALCGLTSLNLDGNWFDVNAFHEPNNSDEDVDDDEDIPATVANYFTNFTSLRRLCITWCTDIVNHLDAIPENIWQTLKCLQLGHGDCAQNRFVNAPDVFARAVALEEIYVNCVEEYGAPPPPSEAFFTACANSPALKKIVIKDSKAEPLVENHPEFARIVEEFKDTTGVEVVVEADDLVFPFPVDLF